MRRNPAELLLLNPAATRPLTMGEVQTVMHALEVPKPWRTRFMQGMDIEWREHGGGIDAHSVGALVIDHLNEDEDYYRRTRQNPAVRIPKGMLKQALEALVDKTGRTEDMLAVLSTIYRERAKHPEYRDLRGEMLATAHVLHEASEAVAAIFDEDD